MKRNLLFTLIGIFALAISSFASKQQSFKIDDQTGQFTARFSVVPNANGINAAVGFGPSVLTAWGDFNCIVAFGTNDSIVVRNGGSYGADVGIKYVAKKRYIVQMDVDVPAKTYTVWITEPGKAAVIVAQDYAFRDNNYTGTLSYFSTRIESAGAEEYVGVSGLQFGENTTAFTADQDILNTDIEPLTGEFGAKMTVTPSHNNMNGLIGLGSMKVGTWGDYNAIVAFGNGGNIVARNGDAYEAVNEVPYKAGQRYLLLVNGNTETKTYNVLCVSPDNSVDTIAWNYGFRLSNATGDEINTLTTHAVYNTGWGGLANAYLVIDGVQTGVLNWEGENPVVSSKIESQAGTFSKTFAVTPSVNNGNQALALSSKESTGWSDMNVIIAFGDNEIKVHNGATYTNDVVYPYKGGKTYQVTLDVDIPNKMFDVTVQGPSPHDTPVKIADDYGFRSADAVTTLDYLVFKGQWNSYGVEGAYMTIADVGITENVFNPDANQAPTIDQLADVTLEEEAKVIDLTGISDGDGGTQTLTVTAEMDDTQIAEVELENISGNDWKLTLTPLNSGSTTCKVTVKDDGGVAGGGEDTKEMTFAVNVGALGLSVTTYKTATIPAIDGSIDANDGWKEWIKCETVMSGTPKDYFSAEYSIMWDDDNFYVAGKCNDNTVSEAGGADHEYDHVEFYFSMSGTEAVNGAYQKGTWQMRGSRADLTGVHDALVDGRWGGNNAFQPWSAIPMAEATGFKSGFAENGDSWSFECQLPRTKLEEDVTDFDGKNFRWDCYFVDNPTSISDISILNWNTEVGPKHLDTRSFGYAVMDNNGTAVDVDIFTPEGKAYIANDILNINNVEGRVQLYSLSGALMLDEVVHGSASINVSYLKRGLYIVRGENIRTKVVK